jgi:hypothetical protein
LWDGKKSADLKKIESKIHKMKILFSLIAIIAMIILLASQSSVLSAPVDVYAGDFIDLEGHPLKGFTVLYEETQTNYTTDDQGYLHLDLPVGVNCTFTLLGQKDYAETQTATAVVPPQGFTGKFNEIVLQVPDTPTFDLLNLVVPHKRNFSQCQVVVTVTNYNKSWYNCPQGFPGVVAEINPPNNEYLYYFGTWGSLSNKTSPLPNKLTSLSWDGGVFFMNIDMDWQTDYTITAHGGQNGVPPVPFTPTIVKCLKRGRLINAAPNQGPRAQAPLTSLPCPDNC